MNPAYIALFFYIHLSKFGMQASADLLVALQCPQVKTILKTLNLSTELTSPT